MPFLAAPNPAEIIPAFSLPSGSEYIVILVVALLLFGKRLPEIMRGLGSSVREFKKGMDTGDAPTAHRDPVPPVDGSVQRGGLPSPGQAPESAPADAHAQQPPKQH